MTFGVRKAEIIPIEPETVSTVEGKCIMLFVELKKSSDEIYLDSFFELFKMSSKFKFANPLCLYF